MKAIMLLAYIAYIALWVAMGVAVVHFVVKYW